MTSTTAVVPKFVPHDRREIRDFHAVVYLRAGRTRDPRIIGMLDAIDWVVGCEPLSPLTQQPGQVTEQTACEEMNRAIPMRDRNTWAAGLVDTLAYLVGLLSKPPLEVPRRNPDGTVVTADEIYQEFLDSYPGSWTPTPEQRDKARQDADVTAVRWQRIAAEIASP